MLRTTKHKLKIKVILSLLLFSLLPTLLGGQTPLVAIHTLQGSGNVSSFVGQTVQVDTAIVLYANPTIAYVQSLHPDTNPLTSEGLQVTGGDLLSLVPGDLVLLTGQVRENEGTSSLGGSVTINKVGTAPLPPAVNLAVGTQLQAVSDYERFEGMLVDFKITIAQGASSSGTTYAYPTPSRPFREPGLLPPGLPGLPMFDDNPELVRYASSDFGQTNYTLLNAGDKISGVGILLQNNSGYRLAPTRPVELTTRPVVQAVRPRLADEVTVGSFNALRLSTAESNYATQLTKVVNYLAEVLQFPDVIGLQEVGGQQELEDLIFRLRQKDPVRGDYYGFVGSGVFNIRSATLVHKRLPGASFQQLGTSELLSIGGILHDRPPLLATIPLPISPSVNLQVINLHLRSLNGIEDSNFVRTKRYEQSQSVAQMVQTLRNDNLLLIGDFNAFEFTDGYVDVMNQIIGRASLGALFPVVDIVQPPLELLSSTLPAPAERYSYVFRGSAQTLDHCVANQLSGLSAMELHYGRGNADATSNFAGNTASLARSSDHDGFVLYLRLEGATALTEVGNTTTFSVQCPNPARSGDQLRWDNPSGLATDIRIYNSLGQLVWQSQERGQTSRLPNLAAATYWLEVRIGSNRSMLPLQLLP